MNKCPICNIDAVNIYCSLSCSNVARTAKNEVKYLKSPKPCKECGGAIPYLARFYNVFCSSSCSASFNNKRRQKKQRFCASCGEETTRDSKHCIDCFISDSIKDYGKRTIESFKSTYQRHRYQKIRAHAHRIARISKLSKSCAVCGYEKHTELAHRKAISSFPKTSKIELVNVVSNLVFLCPTHHWELDAGVLIL